MNPIQSSQVLIHMAEQHWQIIIGNKDKFDHLFRRPIDIQVKDISANQSRALGGNI